VEAANPDDWRAVAWDHVMAAAKENDIEIPKLRPSERRSLEQRFASQVLRNAFGESVYHQYSVQFDEEFKNAIHWLQHTDEMVIIDGQLSLGLNNNNH
jgi:hypothetical protein